MSIRVITVNPNEADPSWATLFLRTKWFPVRKAKDRASDDEISDNGWCWWQNEIQNNALFGILSCVFFHCHSQCGRKNRFDESHKKWLWATMSDCTEHVNLLWHNQNKIQRWWWPNWWLGVSARSGGTVWLSYYYQLSSQFKERHEVLKSPTKLMEPVCQLTLTYEIQKISPTVLSGFCQPLH